MLIVGKANGLQVGHVFRQLGEVRGDPVDLPGPGGPADAGLVRVVGPRLDTRRDHRAVRFLQPPRPVTAQHRERAFDDVRRPFAGRLGLQRFEDLVELHREVGVVEHDEPAGQVPGEVAQVRLQPVGRERAVGAAPVDAEVAPVRAAHAREHRHRGQQQRLASPEEGRRPDFGHPLLDRRHVVERAIGRDHGARVERAGQDVGDQRRIALPDDEVEETQAVHRERLGVRAADHRADTGSAVELRQRVGEVADLRVAGDEHHVQVGGQQAVRPAEAVIGRVERLVALPAAPHRDGLRRDTGVLLGDQQLISEIDRTPDRRTEKVEDSDSHRVAPSESRPGAAGTTFGGKAVSDVIRGRSKTRNSRVTKSGGQEPRGRAGLEAQPDRGGRRFPPRDVEERRP
jgi:hypothetical protein